MLGSKKRMPPVSAIATCAIDVQHRRGIAGEAQLLELAADKSARFNERADAVRTAEVVR